MAKSRKKEERKRQAKATEKKFFKVVSLAPEIL